MSYDENRKILEVPQFKNIALQNQAVTKKSYIVHL